MVLGNFSVPGVLLIWMMVGQGPIALAIGAGKGCSDIFPLLYLFASLSPSLWETEILTQRDVYPKTTNQLTQ